MWRALFIGCLAIALAEDASDDVGITKRQTARGNTVVYGAAPGQYVIHTPERAGPQQHAQASARYQPQSELYIISPNRKPAATALTYQNESPRRPQYIQLSPAQFQAAQLQYSNQQRAQDQQQQQQQLHRHQQPQQQSIQQIAYDGLLSQTEAGHGAFYRPQAARVQAEPKPEQAAPVQYAASSIVDSQSGSFERELAQLVAANRVQEQKYNAAAAAAAARSAAPTKRPPAPEQYLKEITRPTPRPVQPTRIQPSQIQYQHQQAAAPQSAPLYRFIYQQEPSLQQIPQGSQQQYKQAQEPQYVRPQLQQYLHAQPQLQETRDESSAVRAHGAQAQAQAQAQTGSRVAQPDASRSSIYVSQSTPLKKQSYPSLSSFASDAERDEDEQKPVVRIPTQRNRPLTQGEFQQILQSGGYTATLVPSDNPNSPHQEYLLHPATNVQQRPIYSQEKQEGVTYLLPQQQQQLQQAPQQRPVKRRPVYNLQQA